MTNFTEWIIAGAVTNTYGTVQLTDPIATNLTHRIVPGSVRRIADVKALRIAMNSFEGDCNLVREHRTWLDRFHRQFGQNWENLYQSELEAAMCEAAVRRLLEQNGNNVEPNETLDGKVRSPDFRCTQAGKSFFVEVTCISIEKATKLTGSSYLPPPEFFFSGVGRVTDGIFRAAIYKTPQCSDLGQPALMAVGTFHWQASHLCFERKHLAVALNWGNFDYPKH